MDEQNMQKICCDYYLNCLCVLLLCCVAVCRPRPVAIRLLHVHSAHCIDERPGEKWSKFVINQWFLLYCIWHITAYLCEEYTHPRCDLLKITGDKHYEYTVFTILNDCVLFCWCYCCCCCSFVAYNNHAHAPSAHTTQRNVRNSNRFFFWSGWMARRGVGLTARQNITAACNESSSSQSHQCIQHNQHEQVY